MFGISRFAAIAIVCVATAIVGSIYAIFGGLKAIALSDSINGLGLIVGGLLVPVFGFMFLSGQLGGDGSFMDGFDKFLHTNPSYLNAINEVNTRSRGSRGRCCSPVCWSTTCTTGQPNSPSSSVPSVLRT